MPVFKKMLSSNCKKGYDLWGCLVVDLLHRLNVSKRWWPGPRWEFKLEGEWKEGEGPKISEGLLSSSKR